MINNLHSAEEVFRGKGGVSIFLQRLCVWAATKFCGFFCLKIQTNSKCLEAFPLPPFSVYFDYPPTASKEFSFLRTLYMGD
mmetsp:Transcript_19378/g.34330  ORF Transcript_19378/g.34330 Transcript_19378/m.34330 type:complete len:81 (+) Transcript_19378:285-527(+)